MKNSLRRNILLYFTGRGVSTFGDELHKIALAWLMLELTGKASGLGSMMGIQEFSLGIFGLIAGIIVDKFSRKRIIVVSDLIQGLVVFFLLFIPAYLGSISTLNIYFIAFFYPFLLQLFFLASIAFIPEIVPKEYLFSFNAFKTSFFTSIAFIGSGVAGLFIKMFGYSTCFFIDSMTSIFAAICGAMIVVKSRSNTKKDHAENKENFKSYISMLKEGFVEFRKNRAFFAVTLLSTIGDFLIPFFLWIPVAIRRWNGDAFTYGITQSVMAVGMIIGGIAANTLLKKFLRKFNNVQINLGAKFIIGLIFLITTIFFNIYSLMAMMFLFGLVTSISKASVQTYLQETIEQGKMGRVTSVISATQTISAPLSLFLGGVLLDIFSPRSMLAFYGVIFIIQMIVGFRIRAIREYCKQKSLGGSET